MSALRVERTRLKRGRINASESHQRSFVRKPSHIANLSHYLRPCDWPGALHIYNPILKNKDQSRMWENNEAYSEDENENEDEAYSGEDFYDESEKDE